MLKKLRQAAKAEAIDHFFALHPPVIVARALNPTRICWPRRKSMIFPCCPPGFHLNVVADLVSLLNVELAPRITRHGALIEVYGLKAFCWWATAAWEKWGRHRIDQAGAPADRGRRSGSPAGFSKSLVGQAPENIRHFIELRGIGIINAQRIFGMGAVKLSKK